ncbi:hypothetical protein F2P81_010745 [Scophthalmus maximus]|uniref:Uncharacterized protein n=1 Tax=Scophthalmus maximus TaxID=52904 RepID=A0A6A4T3U8_SCOMX|nr:hypothetical protein F2P81_010745 [Scophthalmus maximus]
MGESVGWEELSHPLHNSFNQESGLMNADGEPLEVDVEMDDLELARKRKQLRGLEEQILFKKASIALKTVEPGLSSDQQSAARKGATLRDRVSSILQQRNSLGVLPKVPVVTPPPPSVISPAKEETSTMGFQRFLSLLNKGVDMDLLSRIVNDDSEDVALGEDLSNIQPPAVEDKSELGRSQPSHSGASFHGGSQQSHSGSSFLGGRQSSPSGVSFPGGSEQAHSETSYLDGSPQSHSETSYLGGSQPSHSGASFLGGRQPWPSGVSFPGLSPQSHSETSYLLGSQPSHSGASFLGGRQPWPSGVSFPGLSPQSHSETSYLGESQPLHSGDSLPGCSRTDSTERKTDSPSQEKSHMKRPSLSGDEEEEKKKKKNDRGDRSFGSSSRSESPLAVKKKKKKEEENPKVDEQQVQLQNILKTLGLSLEVEEISKLGDRTQERLYGKTNEGRGGADCRGEQESRQRGPHRQYNRNSSSSSDPSLLSSSSSSSSRSTSRSFSPSPPRRRPSHTSDTKRRRVSERSGTGDGNQDREEALKTRDTDKDRNHTETKVISPHLNQYSQEQTYYHPHLDAYPEFSDYNLPQYSEYTDEYHSAATNSCSTYMQDATPPPPDPSGYPYPQIEDLYFPNVVRAPNVVYPHIFPEDYNLLVNPDLSTSEGQVGSSSNRCLQVISTKQSTRRRRAKQSTSESCIKQPTSESRTQQSTRERCIKQVAGKKGRPCNVSYNLLSFQNGWERDKMVLIPAEQNYYPVHTVEEKRPPTEDEIRFNLRKKLDAFNQKVKHQVSHPAPYLTSQTESVDLQDLNVL